MNDCVDVLFVHTHTECHGTTQNRISFIVEPFFHSRLFFTFKTRMIKPYLVASKIFGKLPGHVFRFCPCTAEDYEGLLFKYRKPECSTLFCIGILNKVMDVGAVKVTFYDV